MGYSDTEDGLSFVGAVLLLLGIVAIFGAGAEFLLVGFTLVVFGVLLLALAKRLRRPPR